jgi:aspartyl-tRNA(Asn)/glutamyl-tRNA(Gln) amidotransferase subunit C
MKTDEALIDRLANLSKLHFEAAEKKAIAEDLDTILTFVDKLMELDVDGVEPLIHMSSQTNVLRPDVVEKTISHEQALKNAPLADSDYFKVPKVLKK